MSVRFDNRSDGGRRKGSGSLVVRAVLAMGAILVWTVGAFALGVGGSGVEENASSEKMGQGGERASTVQREDEIPASEGGIPVSSRPMDSDGDHAAETFELLEDDGDGIEVGGGSLPEGGANHEPGGYDPLDVSGQDVPLLPADKERARAVAAQFVAAAYGYTGGPGEESVREYISGVSDHALTPEFYASPGAGEVERYGELVRSSGARSAALLDLFEIKEVIPEKRDGDGYTQQRVVGYAYFTTADEYDRYGGIEGREENYRQKLTLERYRTTFKVYAASEIEAVRP
jgi:hypothetical protein